MFSWENTFVGCIIPELKYWNIGQTAYPFLSGTGEPCFYSLRYWRTLMSKPRPIDPTTGVRMTPEKLYGKNHSLDLSYPTCLCPLKDIDAVPSDLGSKSSIVQADTGLHTGEYVIKCSSSKCGYIGESSSTWAVPYQHRY